MADWALTDHAIYEALNPGDAVNSRPTNSYTFRGTSASQEWNEFVATTTKDYHGLWLQCPLGRDSGAASSPGGSYFFNLGFGSAGNEVDVYMGHLIHSNSNRLGDGGTHIPLYIPAGTRLTLRPQLKGTATIAGIFLQVFGVTNGFHAHKSFSRHYRMGTDGHSDHFGNGDPVNYSHALGTRITLPTGGSQDLGAAPWHEIEDFCLFDTKYVIPVGHMCRTSNDIESAEGPANSGRSYWFQLGIGDKGDEQPITPLMHHQIFLSSSWTGEYVSSHPGQPCYIARGQRVVARAITSNADVGDNNMTIWAHCFG